MSISMSIPRPVTLPWPGRAGMALMQKKNKWVIQFCKIILIRRFYHIRILSPHSPTPPIVQRTPSRHIGVVAVAGWYLPVAPCPVRLSPRSGWSEVTWANPNFPGLLPPSILNPTALQWCEQTERTLIQQKRKTIQSPVFERWGMSSLISTPYPPTSTSLRAWRTSSAGDVADFELLTPPQEWGSGAG